MRKYNSVYDGNELANAIDYLDKSWLQVKISGGIPGDEVTLDPGNTIFLTNKLTENQSTTSSNWTTSNSSFTIYSYNNAVQYPCYDLFIVKCNNKANSKIYSDDIDISSSLSNENGHIYYLQAFVDGINSEGISHGIALQSNGNTLISESTTSVDSLTLSCRGQIRAENINVALYANTTSTSKTCEVYFGRLTLIDLTYCFGLGNEPSKEWCDEHINMYSPDGQYHSNLTLILESEFKTLTGKFDNNGICLFNVPGFATWTSRFNNQIYANEFNSIIIDRVKRYSINITRYDINNLITNGSLSTNLNSWSTNSTTISNLFNTPTIDNSSAKLLAKATGSYNNNAFPVYQNFRVTTNNDFQSSQILYLQAKVKGSAAVNHVPIVNFGHYNNSTTTSLNYANLSLSDSQTLDNGWSLVSYRGSTYDSADNNSIFAWEKWNVVQSQGYVLSQVDLSSDYLAVDKGFYVANTYSINPTTGKISANQNIPTSSDFDNIVIGKYVVTSKNSNDQFTLKRPTSATNYTNYDYISEIYKVNTDFWQSVLGTYIYVHIYETVPGITSVKGNTQYGIVTSTNANAYPDNGIQNGYWYVKIPNFRNTLNNIGFGIGQYNNGNVSVSNNDAMWIKDVLAVNLTQTFGSGNEPSRAWCDKYININTIK